MPTRRLAVALLAGIAALSTADLAAQLLAMQAGEQVSIDFPVLGRKTVVFETTTRGIDGLAYWHGRLAGSAHDRVFLKQTSAGFVGAIRFAGRQVAFAQQGQALRAVDASVIEMSVFFTPSIRLGFVMLCMYETPASMSSASPSRWPPDRRRGATSP